MARPAGDDGRSPGGELSRRAFLLMGATAALAACAVPDAEAPSGSPTSTAPSSSSPSTATSPPATPRASASATPYTAPDVAVEVAHGPRGTDAVALTFHGAGDPRLAEQILSAAEKAGASLTILAVGTWLEANPAMGTRIRHAGHELGNHTLHHRPMRLMSEPAAYSEIIGGRHVVRRYTSAPTWFRPSGTPHATPHILIAAARAGYATSLSFDVDPLDYTDPGAAAVTSRVLAAVRPGSIVSLHLGHAGTAAAMPAILRGLRSRGLACVTVSDLLPGTHP